MPSASDALVLGRLKKDGVLDQILEAGRDFDVDMLLGWIAKESGGKIADTTSLGERGYFQLDPGNMQSVGADPIRMSSDPSYSVERGLAYVGKVSSQASDLGFPSGELHWRVTKLIHTMGYGGAKGVLEAARAGGADMTSWDSIERYAFDHGDELLHRVKHDPRKWFPLVDDVFARGKLLAIASGVGATVSEAMASVADSFSDVDGNPRVASYLLLGAGGILLLWWLANRKPERGRA